MKSPTLLIIGCGDVGTRVGHRLAAQGWHIIAACRSPERLPDNFERIAIDYTNPATLLSLAHAQAPFVLITPLPTERGIIGYQRGYHQSLQHVVDAGCTAAAKLTVLVSSTRVYQESNGGWVDETSAVDELDPYCAALLAGERLIANAGCSAVIRAAGLYGAGPGHLLARVARGEASSQGWRYSNRIHRDDLAGLIAFVLNAAQTQAPPSSLINAVDDEPAPLQEVEQWLAARLGVNLSPVQAGPSDAMSRANRRCSNRVLHQLGYQLQFPTFRAGYAPLADALQR